VRLHKVPPAERDGTAAQRPDTRRLTRQRCATSRTAIRGTAAVPFGARSGHGSGLAAKTLHEIASLQL